MVFLQLNVLSIKLKKDKILFIEIKQNQNYWKGF